MEAKERESIRGREAEGKEGRGKALIVQKVGKEGGK